MLGHDTGDWLWEDPGAAAMEIMSITDYPRFLERSGYPDRPPGRSNR